MEGDDVPPPMYPVSQKVRSNYPMTPIREYRNRAVERSSPTVKSRGPGPSRDKSHRRASLRRKSLMKNIPRLKVRDSVKSNAPVVEASQAMPKLTGSRKFKKTYRSQATKAKVKRNLWFIDL